MAELRKAAPEQSDTAAVSSLAEVLGQLNGAVTAMPPEALHLWLPGLQIPAGWVDTTAVATAPVARMLVRRAGGAGPWDACELLNLYLVPGRISSDTVLAEADRALRCGGAAEIHTYRRDDVPTGVDGLTAVRVSGLIAAGGRGVHSVYNYYAINTSGGAALIEQAAVVGADAAAVLAIEVECLAESVYQSLLISLHSATPVTQPSGLPVTGEVSAAATQARHLTTSSEKIRAGEGSQPATTTSLTECSPGTSNVGPGR